MKKITLTIAYCFFSFSFLQAQVVYGEFIEVIGQRLQKDTAQYRKIAERFYKSDTTLTVSELSLFYYGSVFDEDYDPGKEERILDAGSALTRREKHEMAVSLFDNFLKRHPACLRALLEKGYTYWVSNDSLKAEETYRKYYQLLDVPLKSGTGESPPTAYVVRSMQDEVLVLNELGLELVSQSLVTRNGQSYHIISCIQEDNPSLTKEVYFNVNLPVKRGWYKTLNRKN